MCLLLSFSRLFEDYYRVELYNRVNERASVDPNTTSATNLIQQTNLLYLLPAPSNTVDTSMQIRRAKNKGDECNLVARSDNTHHTGCEEIL